LGILKGVFSKTSLSGVSGQSPGVSPPGQLHLLNSLHVVRNSKVFLSHRPVWLILIVRYSLATAGRPYRYSGEYYAIITFVFLRHRSVCGIF